MKRRSKIYIVTSKVFSGLNFNFKKAEALYQSSDIKDTLGISDSLNILDSEIFGG